MAILYGGPLLLGGPRNTLENAAGNSLRAYWDAADNEFGPLGSPDIDKVIEGTGTGGGTWDTADVNNDRMPHLVDVEGHAGLNFPPSIRKSLSANSPSPSYLPVAALGTLLVVGRINTFGIGDMFRFGGLARKEIKMTNATTMACRCDTVTRGNISITTTATALGSVHIWEVQARSDRTRYGLDAGFTDSSVSSTGGLDELTALKMGPDSGTAAIDFDFMHATLLQSETDAQRDATRIYLSRRFGVTLA